MDGERRHDDPGDDDRADREERAEDPSDLDDEDRQDKKERRGFDCAGEAKEQTAQEAGPKTETPSQSGPGIVLERHHEEGAGGEVEGGED